MPTPVRDYGDTEVSTAWSYQQVTGGDAMSDRKVALKVRAYRIGFALASIAAIVEVLGAGRRF